MSCYHPQKAFKIGLTENNKNKYKITPYNTNHVEKWNDYWIACDDSFISARASAVSFESITIPCGKCLGCRLDYSREWANRLMLELPYHKSSYFVTLTYNDEHLNWVDGVNPITGEIERYKTLKKDDFQRFMKRLRKNYDSKFPDAEKLRFYACGEYGSQTKRPHYHAIIFGLELDDLELYSVNELGQKIYTSKFLEKCWSDKDGSIGFVTVGAVTWESCAYVARYILKKQKGSDAEFYEITNIVPEFTLMSRKPGIAKQYFLDNEDSLYEYEYINLKTPQGGKKIMPPKYYDRLYDIDYPEEMAAIKEKRKFFVEEKIKQKLLNTSLDYEKFLESEEENKLAQVKSLKRRL